MIYIQRKDILKTLDITLNIFQLLTNSQRVECLINLKGLINLT